MRSNKNKQDVYVPALSDEMKECPLIIRDIGSAAAGYFEVASEVVFGNGEDEQIIDLLIRLYIRVVKEQTPGAPSSAPKTGDTAKIGLFAGLLAASAGTLAALLLRRRRKSAEEAEIE